MKDELLDTASYLVGYADGCGNSIKKLSDDEILEMWIPFALKEADGIIAFARAIEERHGIK